MKDWWLARTPSEQRTLLLGGLGLLAVLIWALAIDPLLQQRVQLRDERDALLQSVAQAKADAEAVVALRQGNISATVGARPGRSLLALSDASAREAGLANSLTRVEPINDRRVRVWLEGASFDQIATWLERLQQSESVDTTELAVDRALAPGLVDARITLEAR